MNNNKWMLTPFQPNWEAIYKELETNGIENLTSLPISVFQQITDGMNNKSFRPINGDSAADRHWLANTTVGEMYDASLGLEGFNPSTLTDAERKLKGRSVPEFVDGSNLGQFKDLTVGDMLNHSVEKGYIDAEDVLPDSARLSREQIIPNLSPDPRQRIGYKGERILQINNTSPAPTAPTISEATPKKRRPGTRRTIPEVTPSEVILPETTLLEVTPKKRRPGTRRTKVEDVVEVVQESVVLDASTDNTGKTKLKNGNKSYRFPAQETGPMSFPKYKMTEKGLVNQRVVQEAAEEVAEGAVNVGNPYFKQVFNGRNLGAVLNLGFAINDFNEARDAGDGVIKAGVKAGAQFVAGEMLGGWMFPVMLAKQVPTMAISAIEGTQKITRQMNSTGRIQTFGEAQFQDTQQLATMRQAGMELAKMSQYNLQQSIMGNEAQYMHKL